MKKILLASSALVLVGGTAFAEVSLEGYAAMGMMGGEYEDLVAPGGDLDTDPTVSEDFDAQFFTDFNIIFTLSGATDGGVSFGAKTEMVDLVENGEIATDKDSDFSVFVKGDFGTVTMGDTDSAYDWALQDNNFKMSGTLNDNEEHLGYSGNSILDGFYDGQFARYDYSFGDFAFGISAQLDDNSDSEDNDFDDPMLAVGAKYSMDLGGGSVALGAAYQGVEDIYLAGISAAGTFGGFSAGILYFDGEVGTPSLELNDDGTNIEISVERENADKDDLTDLSFVGGSLAYTFDAITVGINGGKYDIDNVDDAYGYGITAGYDLGGGLMLQAGYGYSKVAYDRAGTTDVDGDAYTYSFGVAMEF